MVADICEWDIFSKCGAAYLIKYALLSGITGTENRTHLLSQGLCLVC